MNASSTAIPLDGLIGTPTGAAAGGPSVPPSQIGNNASQHMHHLYNSSKQAVPCIFLPKGALLKSDEFLRESSPGFDVLVADELRNSDYYHGEDEYAICWEQHRKASAHLERRTHRRSGSPDNAEVSDLRHHLSKRRKVNGLKSVVTHDYALESPGEEQVTGSSLGRIRLSCL
ncbi:putative zinc finger CCCH domain-containing protein 17-like [Sesbania bispinosa]|nr:putative zinc finger CCCH domain-containing protein 17-like [Sesbania bispinosa]